MRGASLSAEKSGVGPPQAPRNPRTFHSVARRRWTSKERPSARDSRWARAAWRGWVPASVVEPPSPNRKRTFGLRERTARTGGSTRAILRTRRGGGREKTTQPWREWRQTILEKAES